MNKLIINDELRNLLPPLTDEEREGLEASILAEGLLSPLVVWRNIIIDGHCRYDICRRHGIPIRVERIVFNDLDDAKFWIWEHQLNRRNLTPFHRAEIALKLKDVIAAKAKERQKRRSLSKGLVNGVIRDEPIDTREEIGKLAGISGNTVNRVEFLLENADDATKNRLRSGEKGTSIHSEYCRLKSGRKVFEVLNPSAVISEPKIVLDKENMVLQIREDVTPRELAAFIAEHFPVEFVRDFLRCLLKEFGNRCGNEATQLFLLKNCAEYID